MKVGRAQGHDEVAQADERALRIAENAQDDVVTHDRRICVFAALWQHATCHV